MFKITWSCGISKVRFERVGDQSFPAWPNAEVYQPFSAKPFTLALLVNLTKGGLGNKKTLAEAELSCHLDIAGRTSEGAELRVRGRQAEKEKRLLRRKRKKIKRMWKMGTGRHCIHICICSCTRISQLTSPLIIMFICIALLYFAFPSHPLPVSVA